MGGPGGNQPRAFALPASRRRADGTAVIDLNGRFEHTGSGVMYEAALLAQLAWTITPFPTIDRALLTIGGEEKEYYMGPRVRD
jgi:spore germination protein GerM